MSGEMWMNGNPNLTSDRFAPRSQHINDGMFVSEKILKMRRKKN